MEKALFRTGWALVAGFALLLFAMTARYWSMETDIFFLREKQEVVHDAFWRTAFFIHITGGMACLIIGPLQFLPRFRAKYRRLHRTLGKVYILSILGLAAPSGLYMAFFAEGGLWGTAGFGLVSLLWFAVTLRAWETAASGNFQAHRDWMVRSFAATLAAVTLRIWVPLLTQGLQWDPERVNALTAWLSWVPNVLVAEILIRFRPQIF